MELRDTPDEAAFRAEVRGFIEQNVPDGSRARGARRFEDADRDWSRRLGEAGYAGLTWPKEFGGAGAPYSHHAIFLEELARAEAPSHLGVIGLGMAGPTIIAWGTSEQKERYLTKILSAEEIWCQGFSEPDAGSDLAGVRTRIEDRGDHFVVNGQKVWSSFAHIADFCILVGVGLPDEPRYRNLTYVIVDMHGPGVEVRPLVQITGQPEFNEIFFTDVRVPRENLLGEIGGGWQVAMTTLLHERGTLGFALAATLDVAVRKLIALAKEREVIDPVLRDRIAREWVELQALKYTNYRALTTLTKTGIPGPEGSASKLVWSEANQRLTKLALEILDGPDSDEYWQYQQLRSRGNTIEAGTSEILRNIVAERVLGLPREQVMDFSFTQEQEDLRRETRAFLDANPSPTDEQLADQGWVGFNASSETTFLDAAVLFEELGRSLYDGNYIREEVGDDRNQLLAALALEAVGIGTKAVELAVDYVSGREQFGKKIGTYQAVSHAVVDAYVGVELARSLSYWAAWAVSEGDEQAELACAAAKSQAAEAAVRACEVSIQAHGGIGFTWEHPLHRYYKRALRLESALGYGREHRAEIAASLLRS